MEFVRKIRSNFSTSEEVELFIHIFLLVTILPLLIKLLSIPKLMKVLTPGDLIVYKNISSEKAKEKVIKFTDYILSRNFWIYKSICLKRSLVLYHFLRKIGINVHIFFGVRCKNEIMGREKKLEGHAWLVYNGDIFLERNIEMTKTYKVTYFFPEEKDHRGEAILERS